MMSLRFFKTLVLCVAFFPFALYGGMDQLVIGDPKSEKEHSLRGDSKPVTTRGRVGMLELSLPARVVEGQGKAMEFDLQATGTGSQPLVLEVGEIHERRPEVFGYTVEVNGKPVYFRTYQEMGLGPNHYFVEIDRNLAKDGKLTIRLVNQGRGPFGIGRVWLYDDFEGLAATEGTYRKMPFCDYNPRMLLGAPKYDPAVHAGMSEKDYENQLWQTLKKRFEGTPYVPGSSATVIYAFRGSADNRKVIDGELSRAVELDSPSQMVFQGSEWGNHPYWADGLGGYFGDVDYSSIAYVPSTGKFKTSWPQSPGGVTWPTWNNPQLQKFLAHRMKRAGEYYAQERAFLRAAGKNPPQPLICQEWGLSSPLGGDWNNATIAAAKKDGIEFTPGEKMSREQKFWIQKNLSEVPSRFAEVFRSAVGRDSVWVDRGEVKPPEDLLWDQYFFHTFYHAVPPLHDDQWAGWQTGVGPHVFTTGETGPHVPHAYYDYVIALGKLVTVNLERGFFRKNLDFIHKLYELGFQWVTPCNTQPGDADLFLNKTAQQIDSSPAGPVLHADRRILDLRFKRDDEIGPKDTLQTLENLKLADRKGLANSNEFLMVRDGSKPGRVIYRLTNNGKPFEGDLVLEMTGVIADGDENGLEVLIGKDPASMKSVANLRSKDFVAADHWPWTKTASCSLGDSLKGSQEGFFELVFRVKNKNTPINVRIDELLVLDPWPMKSGQLDGKGPTVKDRRTQRLLVQDRAVLERLLGDYATQVGKDESWQKASGLAAEGRYRSAYRHLVGAYAQTLPARFAIRSHGPLGRYPVTVKLGDENKTALVDLLKAEKSGYEFRFTTKEPQTGLVSLNGPSALESRAPNHFILRPDPKGKSAHEVDLKPLDPEVRSLPSELSGTQISAAPGGLMIETQEPTLWMDNPIFVPVASDAIRTRSNERGAKPPGLKAGMDMVRLKIDESGVAREVKTLSGFDSGKIKAFHPPVLRGETSNGVIELENGQRYELGNRLPVFTKFEVPGLKENYRNNSQDDLVQALKPGLDVEIAYAPYTVNGRLPRAVFVKALAAP